MPPKIQDDKFTYYLPGTNGKAVLLVHGLTGAPSEMRYVAKYLQRRGYTVYIPLLAGHGVTEAHIIKYKWQDWVGTITAAHQVLAENHDQVFAAGICAGGSLVLYYEALHPGAFAGIALYSITFKYDGWNVPKVRHIDFLLPVVLRMKMEPWHSGSNAENHPFGIKNDRVRETVMNSAALAGCLPGFPYRCLDQMNKLNKELAQLLPKIKTPVVEIHAENDDASSIRNAHKLKKSLGGRCDLHVLDDSYHMVHVDHQKDEVAKITVEFFNELSTAREQNLSATGDSAHA